MKIFVTILLCISFMFVNSSGICAKVFSALEEALSEPTFYEKLVVSELLKTEEGADLPVSVFCNIETN